MSGNEAKVRCPKCHFRFFVPLAEVGRDGTTPCPNCNTSIPVKTRTDATASPPKAQPVAAAARAEPAPIASEPLATIRPAAAATSATAAPARPWWKFWAR